MVTQIQLGNFFNSGGRVVVGGVGGSGLDTETLINALVGVRRIPILRLEDRITVNDSRSSALASFQQLLSRLKDATNFLRNPPGIGNDADNVFKYRTTTVTSNTEVAGSTYVTVAASPGANVQNYTINSISSIARATKQQTGDINIDTADDEAVSDTPAAGQFKAGTFTLNGVDITLEDEDSLNAVAAKFNAVSDQTGISANIIKIEDGVYQLSFVATETGEDADFDFNNIDPPGTLTDPDSVFGVVTITEWQNAANAVFEIDGVEITRQSNIISDVIDDLTFTLWAETPVSTELTLDIAPDTTIIKNGIVNLANVYNDLKLFAAEQLELNSEGGFAETAVLSYNTSFRSMVSNISAELADFVAGITGTDPSRLSDIGITFTDLPESSENPLVRNILTINDTKLNSAIASNFDAVRKVFEFDFTSDNPDLRVISRTNALGVTGITLTLDPTIGLYQATYDLGSGPVTIDLDSEAVEGSSAIELTGPDGTPLEGLNMIYASVDAATIEVDMTHGLADRVYNIANSSLNPFTGALAIEMRSLDNNTVDLEAEIVRIDEQVERYRQQLLDKFGALEQAIAKINTLLQSIDIQNQLRSK